MALGFLPKLAIALLAGGVAGIFLPVPAIHFAVLFTLFFLLGWIAHFQKLWNSAVWLFVLAATCVFGLFLSRQSIESEEGLFAQQFGPVSGLVVRIVQDPYLERTAIVELVEPPHAKLRMILDLQNAGAVPTYRQTIRIDGVANGRRLGLHSWTPYEGDIPALNPIEQLQFLSLKIRDRLDRSIANAGIPPAFLAFSRAELFGKRSDLDARTVRVLQDNGLTHIIAVSGMHTSLLAAVVFFFLSPALGKHAAAILTLIAVGMFCMMVGLQPSVVRAAICTALTLIGSLLLRRVRLLNVLAGAFIIEFMIFPEHLRHAGFQLSYLAVLAIALCLNARECLDDPARPGAENAGDARLWADRSPGQPSTAWMRILLPILMIQVFTAPLSAHLFYRWSLLSVLSNFLFLPVFTFLIALAAVAAPLAAFWPQMASWLGWIANACLETAVGALAKLPEFFSLSSNYGELPFWLLVAFTTAWIAFIAFIPHTRKNFLIGCAAFLLCFALYPAARNVASPVCILLGGSRMPYAAVREAGLAKYVRISAPNASSLDPTRMRHALRPAVTEFLREGIRRIEVLDASEDVRKMLENDFVVGSAARNGGEPNDVEPLPNGNFLFRRNGLHLLYVNSAYHGNPTPPHAKQPSDISWLALEPDDKGLVEIPVDFKPDRVYISGSVTPERLKTLMWKLEDRGIQDILAFAVDGRIRLWLDLRRRWRMSTKLSESLSG